MNTTKRRGYYEEAYPPMPTKTTKFWRKEIFYQTYRFLVLNMKIIRIVVMGHS
ncbi:MULTISPECIES: hypothetical protein [Labilibaculum]|uniref:hypothetical protein n=1 Tax=Labilibaculum TaxID=2060722 RepID=UPI0015D5E38A|nr:MULTISPECIES: hypothetical protein [Labilibaculum]MDM8160936.1 hypothetical protein [Labilibaculum sp. K2S]MDQ1770113.1 hypothetical protein [Labilibaculum euxinus]